MLNRLRNTNAPVPEYAKGVKNALRYSAGQLMKTQMPNLYNTISTNRDITRDMTTFVRTSKPSLNRLKTLVDNIPEVKYAKDFMKNAKDDLKSGKFYNEEREQAAGEELLKSMGMDPTAFDVDTELDFGDENRDYNKELDTKSSLKQAFAMTEAGQASRTMALAQSIGHTSFAAAEYSAKTSMAIANTSLAMNSRMHVEEMAALENIQNLTGSLVQFNMNIVKPFIDNTRSYYDESLTELRGIKEYLHESTEMQRSLYKSSGFSTSRVTIDDVVSSEGVVNMKDYMSAVKTNVKNMSTLAGGGLGRADVQRMMMQAAASPWAFMSDLMVRGLLPNSMKKAINQLDKSVSGVFSSFILQMNKLKNNSSGAGGNRGFLGFLGEAFGIDATVSSRPDLSIYREQAKTIITENKKLKAITEVIPSLLAKQLAVMTGGDEMAYNYATGRFTSVNTAKKTYQNKLNNLHGSAMDSTKYAMARGLSAYNITDEKERKKLEDNLDTFVRFLGKMGESYNPKKDSYSYLKGKGMKLDEKDYKLMKMAFMAMSESEQIEVPKNQLAAISEIRRNMKLLNNELQDTGLGTVTFGDFDIDYSKLGKKGSKKNRKPRDIVKLSETEERDINSVIASRKDMIKKTANSKNASSIGAITDKTEDLILSEMRKHKEFMELEASNNQKEQQQSFFRQFTSENDIWKRYDMFKSKIGKILQHPESLITDALHTVDKTIYKIMYGDNKDGGPQSIMARVIDNITQTGNKAMKWVDEKILFPIHDKLFGKEGWFNDENHKWAKGFKEFLPKGLAGATIGAVSSVVLPGGPVLGAFMGAGISFANHSEKVKEYLFGKLGEDNKRDASGLIPPEWQDKFKEFFPHGVRGAAGGLIGSFFLPGGPILRMIMGATMGVVTQSEKFKTWMWGDMDPETQKRKGGVAGQVRDFLNEELFTPFKNYMKKSKDNVATWFKEAITGPLSAGKEPIRQAFTIIGDRMKESWDKAMGDFKSIINDVFQKNVGLPLKEFVKTRITDPLKNMLSKVFGAIGKVLGNIVSAPVKGLLALSKGIIADEEDRQNKKQSMLDRIANELNKKASPSKVRSGFSSAKSKIKDTWNNIAGKAVDMTDVVVNGYGDTKNKIFNFFKKNKEEEKIQEMKAKNEAQILKAKETTRMRQEEAASRPIKTSGPVAASGSTKVNPDGTINTTPNSILQSKIASKHKEINDSTQAKKEGTTTTAQQTTQTVSDKTLKRIESYTGLIKDEVIGQLSGVGYNIEYIKNILIDQFGTPTMMPRALRSLRGNFKRIGWIRRTFDFLSKPVKFFGNLLSSSVKGVFNMIGGSISKILKVPFKIAGGIWDIGKGIGGILANTIKLTTTVLSEGVKTLSRGLSGALRGINHVIAGFGKGVGQVLTGIGSAMKDVTITIFKTGKTIIPAVVQGLTTLSTALTKAAWTVGKTLARIVTAPVRAVWKSITRRFDGYSIFGRKHMVVKIDGGVVDKVREVERVRYVDGIGNGTKPPPFTPGGPGGSTIGKIKSYIYGNDDDDPNPPNGGGRGPKKGPKGPNGNGPRGGGYPKNVGGSDSESGGRGGIWGWLAGTVGKKAFALNGVGDSGDGKSFWGRFGSRVSMFRDAIIPYKFKGEVLKAFRKNVEETKKVGRLRKLQEKMKNINTSHDYNARVLELLYTQIEATLSLRPMPNVAEKEDKAKVPSIAAVPGLSSASAVPAIINAITNAITNSGSNSGENSDEKSSSNSDSGTGSGTNSGGGSKRKWTYTDLDLPWFRPNWYPHIVPKWKPGTKPGEVPEVIPFEPKKPGEPIYPGEPEVKPGEVPEVIPFEPRKKPIEVPERKRPAAETRRKIVSLFPKEEQGILEAALSKIPEEDLAQMYKPLQMAAGGEGMEFRMMNTDSTGGSYTIFNTAGDGKGNVTSVEFGKASSTSRGGGVSRGGSGYSGGAGREPIDMFSRKNKRTIEDAIKEATEKTHPKMPTEAQLESTLGRYSADVESSLSKLVAEESESLLRNSVIDIAKASKERIARSKIADEIADGVAEAVAEDAEIAMRGMGIGGGSGDGGSGGSGGEGKGGEVIDFKGGSAAGEAREAGTGIWDTLKGTAKAGWKEGLETSRWLKFVNTTKVGGFLGKAEHILSTPYRAAWAVGKGVVKTGWAAIKDVGSSLLSGAKKVPGVRKIVEAIEDALCNGKILGMLKGTIASALKSNAGKIASEVGAKLAGGALVKATAKIAAKVAAWPVTLAMFIYDFGSGMSSAGQYFEVSDSTVTWGMRAAAGAAKAISGLCIGLIPIGWLANLIYSMVASEDDQQELADNQSAFNSDYEAAQENDPTLSREDYLKQQNPAWYTKAWNGIKWAGGKVMDGINWAGGKIGQGLGWAAGKAWNGLKWAGGKIADGAKAAWNGAKWVGGKVADGAKWAGGKVLGGLKWAGGKVADLLFGDTVASASEGPNEGGERPRQQSLLERIGSGAKWAGGKVVEGAKWLGGKIADGASWAGGKVMEGVSSAANKVKETAVEFGGESWAWLKNKVEYIGGKLGDFWNWLGDKVKPAYEWVKDKIVWVKDKLSDAYGWLRDRILPSWTWVKNKLSDFWNWLWNTFKPVYEFIKDKLTWVKDKLFDFYDWVKDKISPVVGWIHDKLSGLWEWTKENILPKIQWVGDRIGDFINWVGDNIKPVIGWIHDKIVSFWNWTKDNIGPVLGWVHDKISGFWNWTKENIFPKIQWVGEKIGDLMGWIGDHIKPPLEWVRDKASDIWNWLSGTFGGAVDWIKDKMGAIHDAVSPIIEKVGEFFQPLSDLFDWLKSKFTDSWLGKVFGGGARGEAGRGSGIPNGDKVVQGYQYYNQRDPRWASMPFGMYYGKTDTLGDGGCGPTVAAMAISKLTNQNVNPALMGQLALNGGFKLDDNGTTPKFFQAAGSQYGVRFTELETTAKDLVGELRKGRPVVVMGQNTKGGNVPFSTAGPHYVLATGIDSNGNVSVLDPMNDNNNGKYNLRDIAANSIKYISGKKDTTVDSNSFTKLAVENRNELQKAGILPYGKGLSLYDMTHALDKTSSAFDEMFKSSFMGNSLDDIMTKMSKALTGTPDEEGGDDVTASTTPSGGTAGVGNVSQSDFIKTILPGAKTTYEKYRVVPSITLAQAVLESGWGQSNVARNDKNLFGIKYHTGAGAPGIQIFPGTLCPSNEGGGALPYRRYNSWNDSIEDHGYFLMSNSRYGQAGLYNHMDYVSQANALQRAGYAEDGTYGSNLIQMIKQYGFDEADNGGTPPLAASGGRGLDKIKKTYGRIVDKAKKAISNKGRGVATAPSVPSHLLKSTSPSKAVGRALEAIANRDSSTQYSNIRTVTSAIKSAGTTGGEAAAVTTGILKVLEMLATTEQNQEKILSQIAENTSEMIDSIKSVGGNTTVLAARGGNTTTSSSGVDNSLLSGGTTPSKFGIIDSITTGTDF